MLLDTPRFLVIRGGGERRRMGRRKGDKEDGKKKMEGKGVER